MFKKNPLLFILLLSGVFFVIFVAVTIGLVKNLNRGSHVPQGLFQAKGNIGVVELKGVITDSKKFLQQLETFSDEPSIQGVIIRINSPGGAVAPSQEIFDAIRKVSAKKPVYASMGSVAASGGYYAACGAKKIFASPGTITGSIGVIMQFADLSKLYSWAKINPYNIKTGKFKDIGNPNREMSPEEKALLQGMIDNVLGQFRKAVSEGRRLPMEKVKELSDGRIFSGEQAKTAHLVDELGGLSETADALAAELEFKGRPHLIYPAKKKSMWELLSSLNEDDEDADSKSGLRQSLLEKVMLAVLGVQVPARDAAIVRQSGPLYLLPWAVE